MGDTALQNDDRKLGRRAPWLFWGAVVVLLGLCFWWTAHWMTLRWEQPNGYYSHGWLVAPISLFLLYRKRKELARTPVKPTPWGLALLVPSLALHLLGTAWQVGFMSGFALIGAVAGIVLGLFGLPMLRQVLFPLGFLAFMVPVPDVLVEKASFALKLLAAQVTTRLMGLAGVAAVREGSYIRIPTGTVIVDDICSGLKYMISLTAFGALYAYISPLRKVGKATLFVCAVPISFLANVTRVMLMVLAAVAFGVAVTEEWYFHDLLGFLLFVVAFLMLFALESLLLGGIGRGVSREGGETDSPEEEPADPDPAPYLGGAARVSGKLSVAMLGVLAATAVFSTYLAWPRAPTASAEAMRRIPLTLGQWQGRDYTLEERTYELLGTKNVLSRAYRRSDAGPRVNLLVVVSRQTRRRTHPPEQCLTGGGQRIDEWSRRQVRLSGPSGGRHLAVIELILSRGDRRKLTWYFYKSGDRLTTSYWGHQLGVALRKLLDPEAADVLVRVDTSPVDGDLAEARGSLKEFVSRAFPPVMEHLP